MALTEDDLSAMLHPSHPSESLMSMSLANAMLNSSSAMNRDLFSAQLPYSPLQRAHSIGGPDTMNLQGTVTSGMSSMGSGSPVSSLSQWPSVFSSDEKWELDGKNEVLDSRASYGPAQPLQPLNNQPVARTQGLQRYHSAPSSFLQCLADFREEDFAHITNPLGDNGEMNNFFNENLAPIMESAPSRWSDKQPEKLSSTEQYFAIQAENARQSAALRASSESSMKQATTGRADVSGFRARTPKNSLLRQSSSPAELLAAINNNNSSEGDEQLNPIRSQDDSISTKQPRFANPPTYVFNDTMTGAGGAWKMPTSPGGNLFAGKRVRFPEEMTDDSGSDALLGDVDPRRTGTLTRHQSLPSTSTTILDGSNSSMHDLGYDDLLDLYAPCKTRARRGYATHPRSIAERNRRSRISERMKKLQDLVPNMDKQTNTADMLDEAVEYVKHLQLQVKDLSETIVLLRNSIRQQQNPVSS